MNTHQLEMRRSSVTIKYAAKDGYCSTEKFINVPGVPHKALLNGLRELARLTELFGYSDEAEAVFNEAREAVRNWKKENEPA